MWRGYFDCCHEILQKFSEGKTNVQICDELTAEGYAFRSRKGLPTPLETDDIRRITHNWVEYGGRVMDSHAKDRRYEELDLASLAPDPERSLFEPRLLLEVANQLVARSKRHLGKGRRRSRRIYPLSSLVYCAHCEALAKQQGNESLRTRLILGSNQQRSYVHRAGINCGRTRRQVSREALEADFLDLVRQLTVDEELLDTMVQLASVLTSEVEADFDISGRRTAAIARCRRRLEAAKFLYADGEITREEYLKRKDKNEREIGHWQAYTT